MAKTATYYHAGCPVCIDAEQRFTSALDPTRYHIEVAHVGESPEHLAAAKAIGVESVPALVIDNHVFHINFGAKLSDIG